MNLELLFGSATGSLPRLEELLVRMLLAAALGAVVSHRPWRWLMTELPSPSVEGAQAQALLAAAGALTAVVIGDHPARAFGLVGLGSFVRFRSVISDPRDNVVMLMTIAIGMAAGIGRPAMAVGATACAALVMVAFDLTESRGSRVTKVAIISENPPVVRARMAELFPELRVLELANCQTELGKDSGKMIVQLRLRADADASWLREHLDANAVPGIRRVAILWDD